VAANAFSLLIAELTWFRVALSRIVLARWVNR